MSQTKAQLISDLVQALAFTATASAPTNGMFLSATNELAISTNSSTRLTVDSSGNVGIGTTSPAQKLDVNGTIKALGNASIGALTGNVFIELGAGATEDRTAFMDFVGDTTYSDYGLRVQRGAQGANTPSYIFHRGTGDLRLVAQEAAPIVFWTSNTERARIDSSGRLLVGTSSVLTDNASVNIQATASTGSRIALGRNDTTTGADNIIGGITFRGNDSNGTYQECAYIFANAESAHGDDDKPTYLKFATTADGASSPTERMRIDSSGKVGVGITPTANLHVSGTIQAQTGSTVAQMFTDGGSAYFTSVGAFPMLFQTNGSERMRIDSSGNVGIGLTSPTEFVDIRKDQNAFTWTQIQNQNSSSGAYAGIQFGAHGNTWGIANGSSAANSNSLVFVIDAGGSNTERMRLDTSGRLLAGATSTSVAARAIFQASSGGTGGGILILSRGTSTPSNNQALGELYFSDSGHVASASVDAKRDGGTWTSGSSQPTALVFQTTADGASSKTERMRINSSGNVGIGDSSPSYRLDVKQTSTGTVAAFTGSTDGGRPLKFNSADNGIFLGAQWTRDIASSGGTHVWSVDGSEKARIDSSGRMLIGTTTEGYSDADDLTVAASGNAGITIRSGTTNAGAIYFSDGTSGNSEYRGFIEYSQNSEFMRIGTAALERMRINSSGDVNIGSSTYSGVGERLCLTGNGLVTQSAATTNRALFGTFGGSNLIIGTFDSNIVVFRTGNTERMRLDTSGRLFIGSTGFTSNNSVRINMSFTGGGTEYGMCMNAGSLVGGTKYITFDISTTNYGSIGWNGTAIQYYTSSDHRLKENIVSLEGGIERVKQLQPRRFNFIHNTNMTVDGFVAHEAQVAVPEAISGTHNEVDSNGNPVYQNIDLSKFVPLLTAALQEAIAKIETLETKVAALEAE